MDDLNNTPLDMHDSLDISFDSPLNQSSYIKVIGVGGGGNNAVNHMFRKGISGVDFIVTNTDMKALKGSPVPNQLVLGHEGLGVGGRPAKARKAAEEKEEEIKALFTSNTKMIFLTAGMGGGTGTGAAPVIARIAKDIKLETDDDDDPGKILVVAVVTTPFFFEGYRRIQQADEGVAELRKYADAILVISNEKLRSYGNLVMTDAFSMANDVLLTAVKGIAEIITLNAYINIDFRDVYTVMEKSGTALMGIGEGEGENRARQAVEEATTSVLLNDNDISGAQNVLLYFSSSKEHEITMDEMNEMTDYVTIKTGGNGANIIFGAGFDDSLGEKVRVTLIATGYEQKKPDSTQGSDGNETKRDSGQPLVKGPDLVPPVDTPVPPMDSKPPVVDSLPVKETPVEPNPVQEKAQEPKKNIIPLDEDMELPKPQRQAPVEKDDGIHLVNSTQRETVTVETPQPRPQTVPPIETIGQSVGSEVGSRMQPQQTAQHAAPSSYGFPSSPLINRQDYAAMERQERIKAFNELLHNNANASQILSEFKPNENGEIDYSQPYSLQSEASSSTLSADGSVKRNTSLFDLPD